MPVSPSYRNQSIDLHSKSIDWFLCEAVNWFLCEGNTGTSFVNRKIMVISRYITTPVSSIVSIKIISCSCNKTDSNFVTNKKGSTKAGLSYRNVTMNSKVVLAGLGNSLSNNIPAGKTNLSLDISFICGNTTKLFGSPKLFWYFLRVFGLSQKLTFVKCFRKTFHLRCLSGFWIRSVSKRYKKKSPCKGKQVVYNIYCVTSLWKSSEPRTWELSLKKKFNFIWWKYPGHLMLA